MDNKTKVLVPATRFRSIKMRALAEAAANADNDSSHSSESSSDNNDIGVSTSSSSIPSEEKKEDKHDVGVGEIVEASDNKLGLEASNPEGLIVLVPEGNVEKQQEMETVEVQALVSALHISPP